MYSDSVQGLGSVLIEVLIETASSMHTPSHSLSISSCFLSLFLNLPVLWFHSLFPNLYLILRYQRASLAPYLRLLAVDAEYFLSQQSKKTKRNFSDALIIKPWAGFLVSPVLFCMSPPHVKMMRVSIIWEEERLHKHTTSSTHTLTHNCTPL